MKGFFFSALLLLLSLSGIPFSQSKHGPQWAGGTAQRQRGKAPGGGGEEGLIILWWQTRQVVGGGLSWVKPSCPFYSAFLSPTFIECWCVLC